MVLDGLGFVSASPKQRAAACQAEISLKDCGVTSLLAVIGLLCKEQAITVLASSNRVQSIRHLILSRGIISPWWKDKFLRLVILASVAAFSLHLRWKVIGGRLPVFNRMMTRTIGIMDQDDDQDDHDDQDDQDQDDDLSE
ncbi:transmembrane and TPR repeat-containing protein 3 [Caerostris extrusa]|uniref:Transmembrane and TPR repeat-containing protein 3 n=1 Tax=Caerostris extrusa TaxID=172846 RepID=A0AAV4P2Q0_CAEEX|nr:transmembrane and TPR repeat-containing protein 3 [Caerostris extrusa]